MYTSKFLSKASLARIREKTGCFRLFCENLVVPFAESFRWSPIEIEYSFDFRARMLCINFPHISSSNLSVSSFSCWVQAIVFVIVRENILLVNCVINFAVFVQIFWLNLVNQRICVGMKNWGLKICFHMFWVEPIHVSLWQIQYCGTNYRRFVRFCLVWMLLQLNHCWISCMFSSTSCSFMRATWCLYELFQQPIFSVYFPPFFPMPSYSSTCRKFLKIVSRGIPVCSVQLHVRFKPFWLVEL